MDRTAFLSSLPYIIPSPLSGWPPRKHNASSQASNNSTTKCRHDVLLNGGGYQVSLECPQTSGRNTEIVDVSATTGNNVDNDPSLGPMYFPNTNNEPRSSPLSPFDPMMCPIQFCLEYTTMTATLSLSSFLSTAGSPPPISTMYTSPTASTANSRQHARTREYCSAVYLRINGKVYTVDWKFLRMLKVVDPNPKSIRSAPRNSGNDSRLNMDDRLATSIDNVKPQLPPYLLIGFPSLQLRIFSDAAMDSLEQDDKYVLDLQKVHQSLDEAVLQLLYHQESRAFPFSLSSSLDQHSKSATTSPGGASSTTHSTTPHSNSQQQLQQPAGDDDDSRQDKKPAAKTVVSARLKRRHQSFKKCRSNLKTIRSILKEPVAGLTAGSSKADDASTVTTSGSGSSEDRTKQQVQSLLSDLMTSTSQALTSSYIDVEEVKRELHQPDELQKSLDPLLEEFFPARRRRRTLGSAPAAKTLPSNKKINPQMTIVKVQALMDQHRRDYAQRLEMLLLPTRAQAHRRENV